MAPIFEYFIVCGIGPEIRTLDENKGFYGTNYRYLPSLLDQFPPPNHSLYPDPPPQLPTVGFPLFLSFFDPLTWVTDYFSLLNLNGFSCLHCSWILLLFVILLHGLLPIFLCWILMTLVVCIAHGFCFSFFPLMCFENDCKSSNEWRSTPLEPVYWLI